MDLLAELQQLKPLPLLHPTWRWPNSVLEYLGDSSGCLHEMARVLGCVSINWGTSDEALGTIDADFMGVPVAFNYSPYHGHDTPAEALSHMTDNFSRISKWAESADVEIRWVVLDCEFFLFSPGQGSLNQIFLRRLQQAYRIARTYFPNAQIHWYNRGCVRRVPNDAHPWGVWPRMTPSGLESGQAFACRLYHGSDLGLQRETFDRTHYNATNNGYTEVVPWVALGSGFKPRVTSNGSVPHRWSFDWDYDLEASYMLGAWINRDWYRDRPARFGWWRAAPLVILYPGPFDERAPHWNKHFIAYCRGALGMSLGDLA
jgi:hypothetical protein